MKANYPILKQSLETAHLTVEVLIMAKFEAVLNVSNTPTYLEMALVAVQFCVVMEVVLVSSRLNSQGHECFCVATVSDFCVQDANFIVRC